MTTSGNQVGLSIAIINWNTKALLQDCLRSLNRSNSLFEVEVLVVDNASTDGSSEMLAAEFPSDILIRNAENRGFAAANNQAIRLAQGRYLLLLNSDTVVLGDVLSRSVAYMDEHPHVGVFGCRVLNADRTMQPTCFRYPTLFHLFLKCSGLFRLRWPQFLGREHYAGWQRDTEWDVEVVTGCFMMVRRKAIEQVGLMDESFFFFGEETDWCKRFKDAGWAVHFAPVGEIIHHGGASAKKLNHQRDLLLTQGLVRIHRKHGGIVSAALAFMILWFFNASRYAFWTLVRLVRRGEAATARQRHFRAIVRDFRTTWPRLDGTA